MEINKSHFISVVVGFLMGACAASGGWGIYVSQIRQQQGLSILESRQGITEAPVVEEDVALANEAPVVDEPNIEDDIVYIVGNGSCYHEPSCSYAQRYNAISKTRNWAISHGKRPCQKCHK